MAQHRSPAFQDRSQDPEATVVIRSGGSPTAPAGHDPEATVVIRSGGNPTAPAGHDPEATVVIPAARIAAARKPEAVMPAAARRAAPAPPVTARKPEAAPPVAARRAAPAPPVAARRADPAPPAAAGRPEAARPATAATTSWPTNRSIGEETVRLTVPAARGPRLDEAATQVIPRPEADTQALPRLEADTRLIPRPEADTQVLPRLEAQETQVIRLPAAPVPVRPTPAPTAGPVRPAPTAAPVPAPVPAPTAGPADAPGPDSRPEFAAAAVLAGLAGVAGQLVPHGGVRVLLLLVLIGAGPGAAAMSFATVRNRLTAWALATALSLSLAVAPAVLTLWLHIWHPAAALGALAAATLLTGAVRAVRLSRAGVRWSRPGRSGPAEPPADRLRTVLPLVTLPAAATLWIITLVRTSPSAIDSYGMSASLGVPFLIALGLLGLGFGFELFGRARPLVLTAGILAVPAIMQGTVPILSGTIEYAWTYKHLGVVELIRDHGHLIDSTDIYQQWPGFFAVMALLSHVSGLDPISFAAWSSLVCMLVNLLMTAALLRQFTANRRVVALAALLTQLAMWVDIGYFSPQGYVYPLMLAFWLIVVRWLTGAPTGHITRFPRAGRLRAWLTRDMPDRPEPARATRLWAAAAATVVYAAIVVSHQLTPVMMMVPLVGLSVLGVLRPRLLTVVLGVVLLGFLAPRMGSVNSQYQIFDFDLFANASGNASTWSTPEQEFSALVARCLALGLWAAALLTVWRARHRLGTVLVAALLAYLPITTLAGGSYGGEAIYRVYAFSLPFTALLVATLWAGGNPRPGRLLTAGSGLLVAVLMFAGLQGLQGQLRVHLVGRGDITAAEHLYAHATPGAGIILVAPNFPTKLKANYGSYNRGHVSVDISLIGDPYFTGNLNSSRLADIKQYIEAMNHPVDYLVVSESMERQTDYFGTLPHGSFASLEQGLRASPDWKVFYDAPGVTIFQLVR
ncbi:hypothetical protein [Actinoplanes teichomyceticus]|uniref:hypothetical protein n=1 Tax=Actinoplanes teichomyceticus TaxID=1867 RepID=UPI0011EAA63D|nr:hypothetical protein [Actinoplanes teichomyceticus]